MYYTPIIIEATPGTTPLPEMPIPAREMSDLELDPVGIAAALAGHDFIMSLFHPLPPPVTIQPVANVGGLVMYRDAVDCEYRIAIVWSCEESADAWGNEWFTVAWMESGVWVKHSLSDIMIGTRVRELTTDETDLYNAALTELQ